MLQPVRLKARDYASDQAVRWCPGCGDYAILKAVQRALAESGAPRERTVFVSGIGCASRFPYYMATYGMHTIHGRAPGFATGIKLANPGLDVWIVVGDGDGLSIGGNHLLHALRRNLDVQVLLFNNEIYGLTKGQYSPTSRVGTRSPSTPRGSVDAPLNAARLALGAGAAFVARAVDTSKGLPDLLKRAQAHRGASFVEIFQNCPVYNDGVFDDFMSKEREEDAQLRLEHGAPLRFGADGRRGLRLDAHGRVELVGEGTGSAPESAMLHDQANDVLAWNLAALEPPEHPVALGVLYENPRPTFDEAVARLTRSQANPADEGDRFAAIKEAIRQRGTWSI